MRSTINDNEQHQLSLQKWSFVVYPLQYPTKESINDNEKHQIDYKGGNVNCHYRGVYPPQSPLKENQ